MTDYITLLGLVAASITTASFIPQVVKSFRTKQTKDISLIMFSFLSFGIFLWLIYGLLRQDLPMILANGATLILALSILVLKLKHG